MRRERPILYSTPMVIAKLEDRKTHTRRLNGLDEVPDEWELVHFGEYTDDVKRIKKYGCIFQDRNSSDVIDVPCPYGKPGDVLWCRETWGRNSNGYDYKADYKAERYQWKPSIFMPKEAARIWEEIISIRVEPLQDISEDAAIAEGIEDLTFGANLSFRDYLGGQHPLSAVASYKTLWESINGPGSWDLNPWVWVIETKVLSTTGRPPELNQPIALTAI